METTTQEEQIVSLVFDNYEFYKLIEAIAKYNCDINFTFENHKFTMIFYDDSRVILCKCVKELDEQLLPIKKMGFWIDSEPLKELIKTRQKDKKELELIFNNTKKHVEIIKKSEIHHNSVKKTVIIEENELEVLLLDRLYEIYYPSEVSFSTKYLDDFFYESKICSDMVTIEINENGITFSEVGVIGTSTYPIEADYCEKLKGNQKGSYSLELLTQLKPLLPILDVDTNITICILNDHPIYVKLGFESLGMDMDIFLAPRCKLNDDDDDDDEDDW